MQFMCMDVEARRNNLKESACIRVHGYKNYVIIVELLQIDDATSKIKQISFWSVGALKRDNQFVIFTT